VAGQAHVTVLEAALAPQPRDPPGAVAGGAGVEQAATYRGDGADRIPRPLQALAVGGVAHPGDPGGVLAGQAHDVAQHVREPLAGVEALEHGLDAPQPHLARQQLGVDPLVGRAWPPRRPAPGLRLERGVFGALRGAA
jgi:hypothetical protein